MHRREITPADHGIAALAIEAAQQRGLGDDDTFDAIVAALVSDSGHAELHAQEIARCIMGASRAALRSRHSEFAVIVETDDERFADGNFERELASVLRQVALQVERGKQSGTVTYEGRTLARFNYSAA